MENYCQVSVWSPKEIWLKKYGVNRQTVRSALNVLIEDGVLIKVPYKGTFVAKQIVKPAWGNYDAVDDHRGFSSFLKAQGFTIDSKVIVAEKSNRQLRFVHI